MEGSATIRIQAEPFSVDVETKALASAAGDAGALVTFLGICRDEDGRLAALELEHYPGMAEAEAERIAGEAAARWPLLALRMIHRFGRIVPGEAIVFVGAASRHRQAAFAAAEFVMDFMKSRAPFWKREHLRDGTAGEWVAAQDRDETALQRWAAPSRQDPSPGPSVRPLPAGER